MAPVMRIEEPPPARAPAFALWQLGFRPFYLAASAFAALSVALWAAQVSGWIARPYLAGSVWHAHEMLFGFTLAVVVGFLFTAGQNWTGRPTPRGRLLQALLLLWLAGRVLVLTPYAWAAALVNAAFPLAAASALAVPFLAARNRRNYFFIVLLVLLSCASLGVHLAQLQVLEWPPWLGIGLALDVILFIMVVMGGRVIPMFTNNGVPGTGARRFAWLEQLALGSVLLLLALDALGMRGVATGLVAGVAAALHLVRLLLWRGWKTWRVPLVWVLHAAYLWIPLHLALRALAEAGRIAPNLAVHALTIGAIGGLTIGMMTRTARGHTARPLRADRWEITCYLAILLAAVVRVAGPLLWPADYLHSVQASALLWSAGYALYAVRYWPVLSRARLDGRPG
jgi:uncharacterized protein involved in response to NO